MSAETVELLSSFSHLHLNPKMAPEDSSPDLNPYQTPTLALKQALCFFCLEISSNLSRCSACKRVSYCSAKCQNVRPELPSYTTIRHSLIVRPPFDAVVQSHSYEPGFRLELTHKFETPKSNFVKHEFKFHTQHQKYQYVK